MKRVDSIYSLDNRGGDLLHNQAGTGINDGDFNSGNSLGLSNRAQGGDSFVDISLNRSCLRSKSRAGGKSAKVI
jgi:hypothetical protein